MMLTFLLWFHVRNGCDSKRGMIFDSWKQVEIITSRLLLWIKIQRIIFQKNPTLSISKETSALFFTRIEELATFLRCRGVPSSLPPCYSDGFRTGHVTKINPRSLVPRFFCRAPGQEFLSFFPLWSVRGWDIFWSSWNPSWHTKREAALVLELILRKSESAPPGPLSLPPSANIRWASQYDQIDSIM